MLILIDNGHGLDTLGKRSPDGKFLEGTYNREIARRIVADLKDRGYNTQLLFPETEDIPLSERVRRINAHYIAKFSLFLTLRVRYNLYPYTKSYQ